MNILVTTFHVVAAIELLNENAIKTTEHAPESSTIGKVI